ncbi:hypothetical protein SPRA44_10081 [Serratia proteamaculans]|nr:hypothetical protein SPRA44_10081 [Serratia proteamaculans]
MQGLCVMHEMCMIKSERVGEGVLRALIYLPLRHDKSHWGITLDSPRRLDGLNTEMGFNIFKDGLFLYTNLIRDPIFHHHFHLIIQSL